MNIDQKCVNSIRALSSEVISNAKSGHTGIALSAAPIIYSLFAKNYHGTPKDPTNYLRDRFVLSAGHGSALLYTTLHLFGYNITIDDLKNFRKINHITSGHPELDASVGIECTTGPLGQGVSTAVGMAIAYKKLSKYNKPDCKLFDNTIYTLVGDGCLMEGVSYEALSLAGTLKLDNLIVLYDSNNTTLDSDISNTYTVNKRAYFEALGFNYILVKDGNSVSKIDSAIKTAKKSNKPSIIEIKTILGYASDKANTNAAHGLVMNDMQIAKLCENLGVSVENFEIENDVKWHFDKLIAQNDYDQKFREKLNYYRQHYTDDYYCLQTEIGKEIIKLKYSDVNIDKEMESTRNIASIVLDKLSMRNSSIVGGNADLSSCTKAIIKNSGNISATNYFERNIQYGIREFGMGCITNGLALCGYRPFAGTFMVFSDYMRSAIRSSAIMKLPCVYILSHDSIAVGEDGPTHQPIEQLDSFRAMPNINVFRPCNVEEIVASYNTAFTSQNVPSIISLTRQNIKIIPTASDELKNISKGGYIFDKETKEVSTIIIATGSEVPLAVEAKRSLGKKGKGCRVVSIPCTEIFDKQARAYIDRVIPKKVKNVIIVEASTCRELSKYAPSDAKKISVNSFGVSGSMGDVFESFGLTVNAIKKLIK